MVAVCYLMSLQVYLLLSMTSAETITCRGTRCQFQIISCSGGQDCTVDCQGEDACSPATINCPSDSYNCNINCNGANACMLAILNGGGGDMVVWGGGGSRNMMATDINCPTAKDCNVTCSEYIGCYSNEFFLTAWDSKQLNLWILSGVQNMRNSTIRCPRNGINPGKTNNCNINILSTDGQALHGTFIYAEESFSDVNINCVNDPNCMASCCPSRIYCTQALNTYCEIDYTSGPGADAWQCTDTNHVCNDYLLPTLAPTDPTVQPTQIPVSPTYTPTTSDPSSKLIFRQTFAYNKMWDDSGIGSTWDGSVWRPAISSGEYFISVVAIRSHDVPTEGSTVITSAPAGVLANPIGCSWKWDDSGSVANHEISFCQPIPPDGYTCVGDYVFSSYYASACSGHWNGHRQLGSWCGYKCIRDDYIHEDTGGSNVIWWDKESGASDDGSIFRITVASEPYQYYKTEIGYPSSFPSPYYVFDSQHLIASTSNPTTITLSPTVDPTNHPTIHTPSPTVDPTKDPTINPTSYPTSNNPSISPTYDPTDDPTKNPTSPTGQPTDAPSNDVAEMTSNIPSNDPSISIDIVTDAPSKSPLSYNVTGEELGPSPSKCPLCWLWILIAILFCCGCGCIIFLILKIKKKKQEEGYRHAVEGSISAVESDVIAASDDELQQLAGVS